MLWNAHATADRIVVISDLHLGVDDRFSQDVANRGLLVEFIERLVEVGDVRELVVAGDLLDEWIVPLSYPAHHGSDGFYERCCANNHVVFEAFAAAMEAGIKVVYVPGNHDMLLASDVLAQAAPGIVQARDARGMGTYVTGDRHEVAIEHGHRYDVYSAPDPVSNAELAGNDDTLLPPGYFYARLGTEWVAEGQPGNVVDYPRDVAEPDASDTDQLGAYLHYKMMTGSLLTQYTPNVGFDEDVFEMHIGGLEGSFSEYDLCPRTMDDGTISAPTLYRDFQRTWDERQRVNHVRVGTPFIEAAKGTSQAPYFRDQARRQYLDDEQGGIEVVAFGHTHIPDFHDFGDGRLYVNSGTWIDHNLDAGSTRTFAVITTGAADTAELFSYVPGGSAVDITARSMDA
ncbi:MAG: metallophosphoesterase [Atopobiaceae bacterium]|jgi:UDP-2,3-diacylglucosamine pyrophosphatase LpxH|nr:metallophosphoesterase [Atopobiaceae bacterium]MCI2174137.1 metallophosphoesterase [Atopobiaceae bacterium]MCI2206778.1 metallophosphoesterase [Atopobiaceae bacterium]